MNKICCIAFSLLLSTLVKAQPLLCQSVFNNNRAAAMPAPTEPRLFSLYKQIEDLPENTVARVYAEMADRKMLIEQLDQRLTERGLIVDNGGLCGSTCMANVFGAFFAQEGNFRLFPRQAPQIIETVIETYNNHTGLDARRGVFVDQLSDAIHQAFNTLSHQLQFDGTWGQLNLTTSTLNSEFYPHVLLRRMRDDTVGLLTVRTDDPSQMAHAIVLLKVDIDRQQLIISDPNLPNALQTVPYQFTNGTNIRFLTPITFGYQWVEIVQANFLTRTEYGYR